MEVELVQKEIEKNIKKNREKLERGIMNWVSNLKAQGKPIDALVYARIAGLRIVFEKQSRKDKETLIQRYLDLKNQTESLQGAEPISGKRTKKQSTDSLAHKSSNPIKDSFDQQQQQAHHEQEAHADLSSVFDVRSLSQPHITDERETVIACGVVPMIDEPMQSPESKNDYCDEANASLFDKNSFVPDQEQFLVPTLSTNEDNHSSAAKSPISLDNYLFPSPRDFFDLRNDSIAPDNDDMPMANMHLSPLSLEPLQAAPSLDEGPAVQYSLFDLAEDEQDSKSQASPFEICLRQSDFQESANNVTTGKTLVQCSQENYFVQQMQDEQKEHQCHDSPVRQTKDEQEQSLCQDSFVQQIQDDQKQQNAYNLSLLQNVEESISNSSTKIEAQQGTGTKQDSADSEFKESVVEPKRIPDQSANPKMEVENQKCSSVRKVPRTTSQHSEPQEVHPDETECKRFCRRHTAPASIERLEQFDALCQKMNESVSATASRCSNCCPAVNPLFPGCQLLLAQRGVGEQELMNDSGTRQQCTPSDPLSDFTTPEQLTPDYRQEYVSGQVAQQPGQKRKTDTSPQEPNSAEQSKASRASLLSACTKSNEQSTASEKSLLCEQPLSPSVSDDKAQQSVFSGCDSLPPSYQQMQQLQFQRSPNAFLQGYYSPFLWTGLCSYICPPNFCPPVITHGLCMPLLNQAIKPGDFLLHENDSWTSMRTAKL